MKSNAKLKLKLALVFLLAPAFIVFGVVAGLYMWHTEIQNTLFKLYEK